MPVIKSAKKKLRQDKKREKHNAFIESKTKELIKKAKANPTKEKIIKAVSAADKAAKLNIIHKNKAARIKSTLSLLLTEKKPLIKSEKTPKKKA